MRVRGDCDDAVCDEELLSAAVSWVHVILELLTSHGAVVRIRAVLNISRIITVLRQESQTLDTEILINFCDRFQVNSSKVQ